MIALIVSFPQLSLLFTSLLMVWQIIFAGGLVFMKDVNPMWHWMFEVCIISLCVIFEWN